jgi:PAS domain S-box-containing protein
MTPSDVLERRLARALRKNQILEALIEDRTRVLYLAQQKLRASEERFRGLFESSRDAIVTLEPPSWNFSSANPAALAMFCASSLDEFFQAQPWYLSPRTQPDGRVSAEKAREQIDAAMHEGFRFFEWTHRRITGEEFPATVLLTRVELAGERFLQATVRDVTDSRRAEAALHESESNFRSFFESLTDMIIVGTTDGRVLYTNPAFTQTLGFSPDEFKQMHILDLHPADSRPEARELFAAMLRGEGDSCPLPLARKDGGLVPVETRVRSGRWNGGDCIFGICRNLAAEQEAQERFERVFRNNPALMAMSALPDMVFSDVNEAWLDTLGFTRAEVIGRTNGDLGIVVQTASQQEAAAQLERHGRFRDIEMQVRRKDGRILDGLFSGEVIGSQGRRHYLTVMIDITERKRVQEALSAESAALAAVIGNNPMSIQVLDREGRTLSANPAYRKLFGATPPPDYSLFTAPTLLDQGTSALWERLRNGETVVFPELYFNAHDEFPEAPDVAVLVRAVGFSIFGTDGQVQSHVLMHEDVTEQRRAEGALHASERKFRTLVESLAEGVALCELVRDEAGKVVDYRILDVNPAFAHHTGLDMARMPGRLGSELYGQEAPPYLDEYSRVALGGPPCTFETSVPALDRHFRISVISPGPGQFATVFADITDGKRRELELLQKTAEMERFTDMISHDLKSPLVTVGTFLGYVERDLEEGRTERVAQDLGFIRDATERMGHLLEDLLEVSRVGRVVSTPVQMALDDLIQGALATVAGAISTRGVAIQVQAPPMTLFGDRTRLEEVWQNLVENAVKYMGDQPAPRLELGAQVLGAETVFYVRDNGIGIEPRLQGKVFGLFQKLDPASEGTGLGLALVQRIVELHEGRVWVESEGLGRGTCFRFTLPVALKNRRNED